MRCQYLTVRKRFKDDVVGFTLVELLVVISIIGFLASIVLVGLNAGRVSARNAKRKDDIAQIRSALEWYSHENGGYPNGGAVGTPNNEVDIQALQTFLSPRYLQNIPNDPKPSVHNYMYVWKVNNGEDYGLLVPFGNDNGQDCMWKTSGGSSNWFKVGSIKVPDCTY